MDSLPELTAFQQQKLRHLTIVTLSETNKVSGYYIIVELVDKKKQMIGLIYIK